MSRPLPDPLPQIEVRDTRRALGDLARAWRRRIACPVIGITGSNGKTTTKEMTAAILRQRGPVLSTVGNLNNDIGVPLTLFGLAPEHRFAVIEMGANHAGEIARLAEIAEPAVAVVTMCGPAHLEGFGSLEGVARAKGEIYASLGAGETAVINADDPFAGSWRAAAGAARIVEFGMGAGAHVRAECVRQGGVGEGVDFELVTPAGATAARLMLDGKHNVMNALAAAAAAMAAGASLEEIRAGLLATTHVKGRLNLRPARHGLTIIDDTYNANPASLAAALSVLARRPGRRWLLLGDMGELGEAALAAHREAGRLARAEGVERLFTLGELAGEAAATFGAGARRCADHAEAIATIGALAAPDVTLLAKGSRRMALDRVVDALREPEGGAC